VYAVDFVPTAVGTNSGTLTITDNNGLIAGSTQTVTFSGTGTQNGDLTAVTVTPSASSIGSGSSLATVQAVVSDTTTPASVPTGSVTFVDTFTGTTLNGGSPLALVNGKATLYNVTLTGVGTHVIAATYSGSAGTFSPSSGMTSVQVTAATSAAPTISFSIAEKHAVDAPFTVSASSNSTGAITYSLVSGPAAVTSAGVVTLAGTAGTVQVLASQAAGGGYASGSATASFLVAAGSVWVVNGAGSLGILDFAGNAFNPAALTGAGLSTVSGPGAIAFDASGNAWVASAGGVSEFTVDGLPVSLTAYTGGGIASPVALAVDGAGLVWIANANSTVSVLNGSGTAISPSGGYAATAGGTPGGLTIDGSGNVWVTNQTTGTVTQVIGAAAPVAPASTALKNGTTGAKP
jgi:hypothetical protein